MTTVEVLSILEPILENSRIAITIVDEQGNLTLFNSAAERLTGYSRDEVLGSPISRFYSSQEEIASMLEIVQREGKLEDYETTLVGKDGNRIPISILITPLVEKEGRPLGTLGLTVDISQRKQLEAELQEARRQAVFYNDLMCHDIRNFTQTTIGFLQMLMGKRFGELNEEQTRLLQICFRQVQRTRNLIERVQTLSELQSKGGQEQQSIYLAPLLREAIRAVGEIYPDRKVFIQHSVPADCRVLASPLLFELLYNLISNGVAHNSADDPRVWITVEEVEVDGPQRWRIVVEDNGPGITDDRKEMIFDRFTRLESHGSGIGLSLVKALVSYFGGSVWVEDRVKDHQDQGARFITELLGGQ
ncbi:MAG: PAS domain S-box protein [Bradymonadales bacterium]|nr:PAS domain S-box protein [Bradymonadales bacterium]